MRRENMGSESGLPQVPPSKPKNISINIVRTGEGTEALYVWEVDNAPYGNPVNRTGYYNMSMAYWIRHEFPTWAETAHITVYPEGDVFGVCGLTLS